MARTIVLAYPDRNYAERLAEYLREAEPGWETSAFTQEAALRIRLRERPGGIDLLVGHPELLRGVAGQLAGAVRIAALVEDAGTSEGDWPEIELYQPLPGVAAGMRACLTESSKRAGSMLLTVFSAAGGAGKTTAALNLVRLAGERGMRTLYLNLEPLNATCRLFGPGEPDSLSRLLYSLQTEPERFSERLAGAARYQPYLRTFFLDAPLFPEERTAMSPDTLGEFVERIRQTERYELIVADPDSGATPWHARLIGLSDRVAWLAADDWQSLEKTEKLLRHWRDEWPGWAGKVSFVRNRGMGTPLNRWNLPAPPAAVLPYVPSWKMMDEPGRMFGSAAYCGALDGLLDEWEWGKGRKEAGTDGFADGGR